MTSKKRSSAPFPPASDSGSAGSSSVAGEESERFARPYRVFAAVYDEFMEHVPYAAWADYLLRRYRSLTRRSPSAVTDLACGTGQLLSHIPAHLRRCGMDREEAMLERARQRVPGARFEVGRLEERLKFSDRSQPFLVSTHDSLNYLTRPEQLADHFMEAARILEPGGLYSLDLVSLSNIVHNFDNQTLHHRVRGCALIWKNRYDSKTRLMRSDLEFYTKGARESDPPAHTERHVQRFYGVDEVRRMAAAAGLDTVLIEGDYEARAHRKSDNFWNLHLKKKKPAAARRKS